VGEVEFGPREDVLPGGFVRLSFRTGILLIPDSMNESLISEGRKYESFDNVMEPAMVEWLNVALRQMRKGKTMRPNKRAENNRNDVDEQRIAKRNVTRVN
jgi:hypothetical protein